MKIISRNEASSLGLVRFFDGRTCKHGHQAERYVKGGGCVKCALIYSAKQPPTPSIYNPKQKAEYYAKNREQILLRRRSKVAAKIGITISEYLERLQEKNDPAIKEASKVDRKRMHAKKDYKRHKDRYLSKNAIRRSQKKSARASWANANEIRKIYRKSEALTANTGIQHNVDHIVQLSSDIVCGLHCEHNLRVITQSENMAKGNRFDPDAYVHELPG